MIYIIVTTSIINNEFSELRKLQYLRGINKLIVLTKDIKDKKIIIVENNGIRNTYLDDLGEKVFYTTSNYIQTENKGIKEIKDVFNCISNFNINDNDFIVKITGRYILEDSSNFINELRNLDEKTDCIIRYGPYFAKAKNFKVYDCVSGLIGMRCKYVKKIEMPAEDEAIEWKWAKSSFLIDDNKIKMLDTLGIYICPSGNDYFIV